MIATRIGPDHAHGGRGHLVVFREAIATEKTAGSNRAPRRQPAPAYYGGCTLGSLKKAPASRRCELVVGSSSETRRGIGGSAGGLRVRHPHPVFQLVGRQRHAE